MHEPAQKKIETLVSRIVKSRGFSSKIMDEVQTHLDNPGMDKPLEDWRELPFVTIDNEDTMDLDQAIFVERLINGWRVFYALADAAYYVRPGSELWKEALARGTSLYLPGQTIPMLPFELSEGLISLNPNVDRRALIFIVDVDHTGHVGSAQVSSGLIHSVAKLSYEGVQTFYDAPEASPISGQDFSESISLLRDVALARIESARDRDALDFDRFDLNLELSPDGERLILKARNRNDVERYSEQISLLCNMEGARLLHEHGRDLSFIQTVFRVHLPPLSQRLNELRVTLTEFVEHHGLGEPWIWKKGVSLAEYLGGLPVDPESARLKAAVERQVRSANRSSHFSPHAGPHFALGVDQYARFTAPMREIVGIFTHKELLEALGLETPLDNDDDIRLRDEVIEAAHQGNARQRLMDKEITLMAIQQELMDDLLVPFDQRPRRLGSVVVIKPTRFYVLLDGLPMEVKVYLDSLEAETGQVFRSTRASVSSQNYRFGLGDEVRLVTKEWDPEKRRIVLIPEPLTSH